MVKVNVSGKCRRAQKNVFKKKTAKNARKFESIKCIELSDLLYALARVCDGQTRTDCLSRMPVSTISILI